MKFECICGNMLFIEKRDTSYSLIDVHNYVHVPLINKNIKIVYLTSICPSYSTSHHCTRVISVNLDHFC